MKFTTHYKQMKITKLYVAKNDKKTEDKHPDLILSGITEDGTFIKVGAFWKSKSGKGYSGKVDDRNATLDVNVIMPSFNKDSKGNEIKGQEITAEDIPFN